MENISKEGIRAHQTFEKGVSKGSDRQVYTVREWLGENIQGNFYREEF